MSIGFFKKIIVGSIILLTILPSISLAQEVPLQVPVDFSNVNFSRLFTELMQGIANWMEGIDESNIKTIEQYDRYITQLENRISEVDQHINEGNLSDSELLVAQALREELVGRKDGATTRRENVEEETDAAIAGAREDLSNEAGKNYSCNIFNLTSFSLVGCGMYILTLVFAFILWILSLVLWIASQALNFSIDISINQFHTYAFAEGVKNAWSVTRDLANIFFIFILLYIAINTVLNRGGWEKMIANVIVIALLVNFSAVIPRVIIDASNVLALQIYTNMVDKTVDIGGGKKAPDISGAILNTSLELIGWKNLGGYTAGERPEDEPLEMKGLLANSIGAAVIMVVIAFILIVAAILFLYRTIMLLIAIITSPLAVMAWALPKHSGKADKWLSTLVSEATYAPVFLFFLYIALKVYTSEEFDPNSDLIPRVVMFIVFTSMVMFALMAAKSMGATGGAMAEKWGGKFKGLVTGAALGVGGAAGVYALGRTSQKILEQPWMKNLKKSGAGRLFNDLVVDKTLGKAAASKYGSSQSYKERVDKNADRVTQFKTAEDQAQYIASLGTTDRAAAWGKLSERQKAEVHTHIEKIENDARTAGRSLTSSEQKMVTRVRGDGTDKNKGLLPPMGTEARDKFDDEVRRVQETHSTRDSRNVIDAVRPGMSDAQIAAEMSRATKRTINPVNIDTEINSSMARLTGKTVTRVSPDIISNPRIARHLSVAQLQSLHRDGSLTDVQKIAIRTEILRVAAPGTATHTWLTANQAGMTFGVWG